MISFVQGRILGILEKSCLILTASGLGYEVYLSSRDMGELPGAGEEAGLYTLTVVREDALDLYGFFSLEARQTFSVLLNTPKLGPKTALAMLSIYSPDRLRDIIATEDDRMLAQVPGIGVKTARRIIIDLKDRLNFIVQSRHEPEAEPSGRPVRGDVITGLTSLGYTSAEVTSIVDHVLDNEPDLDVSAAIRAVLKIKAREKV
ncbi:MAG: Holliday junction branch migration protein RuvA [Desulfonatronovibrionaceae bacterium]